MIASRAINSNFMDYPLPDWTFAARSPVLRHVILLPDASPAMLPVSFGPAGFEGFTGRKAKCSLTPKAAEDDLRLRWSLPCRSGTDVLGMVLHLGDQPLNGFAAPTLHATPQRT
jgi:hypothetical protein